MPTSKPLRILIVGDLPENSNLVGMGHIVHVEPMLRLNEYDLILGPNCARFLPGMEFALDSFIKGARMVKYGKPAKKEKK